MTSPQPTLAVVRLGIGVLALIACGVTLAVVGVDGIGDLLESASESRWGVVGFIALYILLVIAFAPGTVSTITSAAVFGFGTGLFISLVGATVGATCAFIIGRAMGRDGVVALLGDRLRSVDQFIDKRQFISIFVLRLLPVVPFNGLNYAAGLTVVPLSRYVPATFLGILPGTTLTTFTVSQAGEPGGLGFQIGLAVTVVAVIVSAIIARRFTAAKGSELTAAGPSADGES